MSTLEITLGTASAIEAGTGKIIPGQQTTTIVLDDEGMSMVDILSTVQLTVTHHMTEAPVWVQATNAAVQKSICELLGVPANKKRPATWGKGES